MKTFVDNAGRTWTVALNIDALKRVRDLVQVNLLEVIEGKLLERLIADPVLLCDVIFCLVKPEADAKSVSDVDFGRAMAGSAIEGATDALLGELVGFFPSARGRMLAKALAKLRALESKAIAAVELRLESPELEQQLEAQLAMLGNSSGSVPASSASTPDR